MVSSNETKSIDLHKQTADTERCKAVCFLWPLIYIFKNLIISDVERYLKSVSQSDSLFIIFDIFFKNPDTLHSDCDQISAFVIHLFNEKKLYIELYSTKTQEQANSPAGYRKVIEQLRFSGSSKNTVTTQGARLKGRRSQTLVIRCNFKNTHGGHLKCDNSTDRGTEVTCDLWVNKLILQKGGEG